MKFLLCLLCCAWSLAQAQEPNRLHFSHHDWEIACDNTRTCRVAAYQADGEEYGVSVLFTRVAGPGTAVTGELAIGNYDQDDFFKPLPPVLKLNLQINGKSLGLVEVNKNTLSAALSPAQVTALLASVRQQSVVEFVMGKHRWILSGDGGSAVLLKMDEFQGRLGTPSALVRKGNKPEETALRPLPALQVKAAALASAKAVMGEPAAVLAALRGATKEDDCADLFEGTPELTVLRLSASSLLVSTRCWMAAYNEGIGYWVVNEAAPYQAVLVTTYGSEFESGKISAAQKGRGLGDCYVLDTWTWDGKRFIHSSSATTGLCKLIAAGGPWKLPTIVSTP